MPAEGFSGDVPEFPLGSASPQEVELWADLWRKPQAVMWDRMCSHRTVARYAFLLSVVEDPTRDVQAAILGEVRQLEQQLGVTPKAMRDLRWEIVADEVAERREEKAQPAAARPTRRLKVAPGAVEA